MKKLTLILTTLLLAVSFMAAQTPKEKPTIVVIPFETKNIERNEVNVLFEIFTNEISDSGKFKVVDRSKVDKIRDEHSFQSSDWSSDEKVAKLGNALNANIVVTGQLMPFMKKTVASFRMLDINTMEIVSSATERVNDISDLFDEIPNIVKKLTGEIKNTSKTENVDVATAKTETEESYTKEESAPHENKSQDIDFSFPKEQVVSERFSKEELSKANNRYLNNITAGAMLLTFGIMSSVAGLILTIIGFVNYDYYNNKTPSLDDYKDYYGRYDYDSYHKDYDYYSEEANGFLAMGIIGVTPLLVGGLLMTFLSAIPFSKASAINKKYFTVSGSGGYGKKNERLEIAFGYRF